MMRKSKIRRTIEWCYENGKSFIYIGAIYNVDKLGADINLSAVACVDKKGIERVKHDKVYYFLRTKGAKNE